MKKSIKFVATLGVNEGYGHNNEKSNGVELVSKLCQNLAEKRYKKYRIYISTVISPSKTVYSHEWGCPIGGEETVIVSGIANPDFVESLDIWKKEVLNFIHDLKKELKQSTVTIEFQEVDLVYLK